MLRCVLSGVLLFAVSGLLSVADCAAQCRSSANSAGCGVPTARVNAVNVDIANQLAQASAQAFAPAPSAAPVTLPAPAALATQGTSPVSVQAVPGAAAAAASSAPITAAPVVAGLSAASASSGCANGSCGGSSATLRQRLDIARAQRNIARATRLTGKAASGGRVARRGANTSVAISAASGS